MPCTPNTPPPATPDELQRIAADLTARNRRYRRLNRRAATGILAGTAIALAGAWLGSDDTALAGFLVTFATVATTITVDIVWARRDAADPVWRHAPGFSPRQYHFYGTRQQRWQPPAQRETRRARA